MSNDNTSQEFTSPEEYQALARRTQCSQDRALTNIIKHSANHTCKATTLLHGVLGLMGEVGELAACLERWLWYDQEFDETNFKEELGDADWYEAELHNAMGISMLEVMRANIRKLKKRYPEKYDDKLAREENRDRKSEEEQARTAYFVPPGCEVAKVREEEMKAALHPLEMTPENKTPELVLPPAVWCRRLGAEIIDADGWSDKPYHERICLEEFVVRWLRSTCRQPPKGQLKELVDRLNGMTYKTVEQGVSCLKLAEYIGTVGGPERQQTGQGWAEPLYEEEAREYEDRRGYKQHDLYKKGDKGAPDSIKDSNGDIVLGLCKVCGRAEVELDQDGGECPGERKHPEDEPTVTERLFPDGPGYYRNNLGPEGRVVKLTAEEVEQMKNEGHHMMDCAVGSPVNPDYLYKKFGVPSDVVNAPPNSYAGARIDAGDGTIHDSAKKMVIETADQAAEAIKEGYPLGVTGSVGEVRKAMGQDESHWTDPPKNGFDVARDIASQYAEGQNRACAMRTIDSYEKTYKEHQAQCRHEDPDRSGYCIKCGTEL